MYILSVLYGDGVADIRVREHIPDTEKESKIKEEKCEEMQDDTSHHIMAHPFE